MNSGKKTQLLVIGAGPGGYTAAFYAADLGLEVTLVDTNAALGGVCLRQGCIPSKALLHAAKILSGANDAKALGISFSSPGIDLNKLRGWKDSVVQKLTGGLGQLSKRRNIRFIQGKAVFLNSTSVEIEQKGGPKEVLSFSNAILSTGSAPASLPGLPDSARILDSTAALELRDIPKSLFIIGGGYIGLELGTVYAALGSAVSVVEMTPRLLPGVDPDLVAILERRLKTRFNSIMLETKVTGVKETSDGLEVTLEDKDGMKNTRGCQKALVAVGRKPNTDHIGLENTGVKISDDGFVQVDPQRRTAEPSIFAIGDITGQPMLAHKAAHEARAAVEAIAGQKTAFEPKAIPAVVFTDPEIAWCGLTEAKAKERNIPVEIAKFPWAASGRAITLNDTDGLTKLLIDPQEGRILGVGLAGPGAGEMISEGTLAIEMGATAMDLRLSIHPHPTLSETIMEAAESFFGHSTHIYKPNKDTRHKTQDTK